MPPPRGAKMVASEAASVARKNSPPVRVAMERSRPSSISTSAVMRRLVTTPVTGSRIFTVIGTRPPRPTPMV